MQNEKSFPFNPLEPTLFHETWWLDLSTHGNYRVAEVLEGGRVIARLPYFFFNKRGLPWIRATNLTHFLGPAIHDGDGSPNTKFIKRYDITRALIGQLPAAAFTEITCHRGVTDIIAFQETGFESSVQFTYEIAPDTRDNLWSKMRHERRRVIKRAEETLSITTQEDIDAFLAFYEGNLHKRNQSSNLDFAVCKTLIEAARQRGRGEILTATNAKGETEASIFVAWDAVSAYYLMTTRAPNSSNGAVSALVWKAVQDASTRNLIFDFDGLFGAGGVLFYIGFGSTVAPRYVVRKMSLPVQMALSFRNRLRKGVITN